MRAVHHFSRRLGQSTIYKSPRLSTSSTVARRGFAEAAPPSPPQSATNINQIVRKEEFAQAPQTIPRDDKKSGFEPALAIFLVALIGIPPLSYYYYQYRDQHMREKKEAILKDMQARAALRP